MKGFSAICRWKLARLFLPVLGGLALAASLRATVLPVISEDEQIRRAETIFRGKVERIDVARKSIGGAKPVVVSTVSFLPLAVYKGSPTSPVALDFLGGTIDGKTMRVDGMPQFSVGQEYILFVSGTKNLACPVVGWAEGSLKVDRTKDSAGAVTVSPEVAGAAERSVSARSRTVLTEGKASLPAFEQRLKARIKSLEANP